MRGGATILERGIAADVRELHPLTERGVESTKWATTRAGKFNTILNNVVHDKTSEPYDKDAMELIKSVARSGRFEDYGRAQTVPGDMLRSNEKSRMVAMAALDEFRGSKHKRTKIEPAAADAGPAAAGAEPAATESASEWPSTEDEEGAPEMSGRGRGDQWHYGQNRRCNWAMTHKNYM